MLSLGLVLLTLHMLGIAFASLSTIVILGVKDHCVCVCVCVCVSVLVTPKTIQSMRMCVCACLFVRLGKAFQSCSARGVASYYVRLGKTWGHLHRSRPRDYMQPPLSDAWELAFGGW